MRSFKCSPYSNIVDLDNPETYSHLKYLSIDALDNRMFNKIGYALTYCKYIYPGWDRKQLRRINKLIKKYANERLSHFNNRSNRKDKLWFCEQVFVFEDEIENLC